MPAKAPANASAGLGRQAARGGVVVIAGQAIRTTLHLASLIVLARFVAPEEHGLVGMATAITGFAMMFTDLGLSSASIQVKTLSREIATRLFWVNTWLGLGLSLLALAAAPLIALGYDEPRLTNIIFALSPIFLVASLGVQHRAQLQRQLSFLRIALADVVGLAIGVATGATAAVLGAGPWALVLQALAHNFSVTILLWLYSGWRPAGIGTKAPIRGMLAFGGYLTGYGLLAYGMRNLDKVLLGWARGARALGFYGQAYRLMVFPLSQFQAPLNAVMFPILSRMQDDPERMASAWLRSLRIVAWLSMPAVALIAIGAPELVAATLGERWAESAVQFRFLAVGAMLQPTLATVGWLYLANGRGRDMFRWGVLAFFVYAAAFGIGAAFGGRGMAIAHSVAVLLLALPAFHYAIRGTSVRLGEVVVRLVAPLLTGVLAAGVGFGLRFSIHQLVDTNLMRALLYMLFSGVVCVVIAWKSGVLATMWNLVRKREGLAPATGESA